MMSSIVNPRMPHDAGKRTVPEVHAGYVLLFEAFLHYFRRDSSVLLRRFGTHRLGPWRPWCAGNRWGKRTLSLEGTTRIIHSAEPSLGRYARRGARECSWQA